MKKSYIIALGLFVVIALWMLSGLMGGETGVSESSQEQSTGNEPHRITVEVDMHHAESVKQRVVSQGQVEPNRSVAVRAEVAGRVAEIPVTKGQSLKANDVLVRLEMNDREARLKRAEALLHERKRAYERSSTLGDKGFQAQGQLDESFSALQSAEADLAAIRLEINNTSIRVPFDGILERLSVELGDFVSVNGEVAIIVDNDPLVVVVQVSQQDIKEIDKGVTAEVSFATGEQGEGKVRYISPRADAATRTFRVEIQVANPQSEIPSGTSAEARIPTDPVSAHFISPALLSLNEPGEIGVKTVDEENVVQFYPVTIVLAEADGIWVTGLPEQARIITVGQGFVRPGEKVDTASREDRQTSVAPTLDLPVGVPMTEFLV